MCLAPVPCACALPPSGCPGRTKMCLAPCACTLPFFLLGLNFCSTTAEPAEQKALRAQKQRRVAAAQTSPASSHDGQVAAAQGVVLTNKVHHRLWQVAASQAERQGRDGKFASG